jgi:eukaryotic-like serine/threonine-protein kinase
MQFETCCLRDPKRGIIARKSGNIGWGLRVRFWEFQGNIRTGKPFRWLMVEAGFQGKWGKVIAEFDGTFGTIFTLDQGRTSVPQYVIAKAPKISRDATSEQIREKILRFLHQINETYKYIHHPLIARHFEVKVCFGLPFALSRKWDLTLQDLIDGEPVKLAESLSIVIQLAHALGYCATRGLSAHQDLKPSNVLLDRLQRFRAPDGSISPLEHRVLICDFGMANAFRVFGKLSGSRPYMAPEQYGEPSTLAKADVFALGVILHELVTGGFHPIGEITSDVWPDPLASKPNRWKHEDVWKKWARHATVADPGRVSSPELVTIIKKCLEADLSDRYSSASLEVDLLEFMKSHDKEIYDNLILALSYFDDLAATGEVGGWPYYDELLEQVNSHDYS